jgi:hypothetical protein
VVRIQVPGRNPLQQQGTHGRLQAGALDRHATSDAAGALVFSGIPLDALVDARIVISFGEGPPAG